MYDVITDAEDLPRWWPSVYLDARVVEPGGEGGIGRVVTLHTKGFLPYTLRWDFRVLEVLKPDRLALEARGDFVGRGVWDFRANGTDVDVTFDWRVRAEKPLLRAFSGILKPVFSANHRWAMDRGLESLRLELRRRRARDNADRSPVPAPPGPTFPHNLRRRRGTLNDPA